MLNVVVPEREIFIEQTNQVVNLPRENLQLEHSLVSLSKWESKWNSPFLKNDNKTAEQVIDYIRCMTINKNVSATAYTSLPMDTLNAITEYINAPMTATTFRNRKNSGGGRGPKVLTAEVIYYYMIVAGIPMECEKWHLARLFTLLRVVDEMTPDPKNKNKKPTINDLQDRASLNEQRRKELQTKG